MAPTAEVQTLDEQDHVLEVNIYVCGQRMLVRIKPSSIVMLTCEQKNVLVTVNEAARRRLKERANFVGRLYWTGSLNEIEDPYTMLGFIRLNRSNFVASRYIDHVVRHDKTHFTAVVRFAELEGAMDEVIVPLPRRRAMEIVSSTGCALVR